MSKFRFACAAACALIVLLGATEPSAQSYPTKPVRLVVAFSPGSVADVIARILARNMSKSLGQTVFVDNRAGGSGNTGAEMVAKGPADGHWILLLGMAHAANTQLYQNLGYDLLRDLAPVSQAVASPKVLVVHPSLPARSLPEFVELAADRPGDITYCSSGVGTPSFLAGELLQQHTGINLLHVPYRSRGEAISAVATAEVMVYFAPLASALPNIRQGKLRPLAVTSSKRTPLVPGYPTVAEFGYPDFKASDWYGLAVQARTPGVVIASIRGALLNALGMPDTIKPLAELGYVPVGDEPDEFEAHIRSEIDKLARILQRMRQQ